MLVLSRVRDEVVHLYTESGEKIRLTVTSLNGKKVRLGFEAPQSVRIIRAELDEQEPAMEGEISDEILQKGA